jgi:hypothetical protein
MAQVATIVTYVRYVPGSNLARDTDYSKAVCGFLSHSKKMAE